VLCQELCGPFSKRGGVRMDFEDERIIRGRINIDSLIELFTGD
jgi:hypothetical protein